jgi:hypothetical protein
VTTAAEARRRLVDRLDPQDWDDVLVLAEAANETSRAEARANAQEEEWREMQSWADTHALVPADDVATWIRYRRSVTRREG